VVHFIQLAVAPARSRVVTLDHGSLAHLLCAVVAQISGFFLHLLFGVAVVGQENMLDYVGDEQLLTMIDLVLFVSKSNAFKGSKLIFLGPAWVRSR